MSDTASFHFDEPLVYMKSGLVRVDSQIIDFLIIANKQFDKGVLNSYKDLKH